MAQYTQEKALAHRGTGGSMSDDEAVPDSDPTNTSGLLSERLQAWKHACGYLEDYIGTTAKIQKAHSKEYEKVLKTVSNPLKEGQHFDQTNNGVAGLFENIRSNTQGIANSHLETEKNLKGSVLPILERLHAEIKNKSKELSSGAAKGAKSVEKSRNITQKHIELLGQHTGAFDTRASKVEPANDPYIIQRGIHHRLHKQILEENNNRNDLIAVQDSFLQFEGHVIQTIQAAMSAFYQYVGGQADLQKGMYANIVATTQRIPLDFEWKGFLGRNSSVLVDPSQPPRSISHISFPNQDHRSTQPLIAGTLERKSRAMGALKGYSTGYYVVTPSHYLHEFKDDDNVRKDPVPEMSLYLPDCTIGAVVDEKFNIKGKDTAKGKLGGVLHTSSELSFKAHSPADADKWWSVIREASDESATSPPATSIAQSRNVSGASGPPGYHEKAPPLQTQGLPQGQGQYSAGGAHSAELQSAGGLQSAGPQSAVSARSTGGTGPFQSAGVGSGASPATQHNPTRGL